MTHEFLAQPELDPMAQTQLFNVGAMENEQIRVLYRGLDAIAPADIPRDDEAARQTAIGDALWEKLAAEVCDLALHNPARVRELVERSAQGDEADREFAAITAGSLIDFDYDFTVNTLVGLYTDQQWQGSDMSSFWAGQFISHLMRDKLTPDQAAAINGRIVACGYDPRRPATPGEIRRQ